METEFSHDNCEHHSKGHNHNHCHNHSHSSNKQVLKISFILIAVFMIVEFVGGYLTNSLALLSDAGHMLSDTVALGISLMALIIGARSATPSKTYGYKRFEILAALLNGIILVLIAISIFKEAIERLSNPPSIVGKGMIIISVIGLIINIVVAWILHSKGSTEDNLNIRSAFLHVLGDLLGSVGAIVAAILIICFKWNIADPIISMIVSILVLLSGWRVLKESVNILMEAKPVNIDSKKVIETLKSINGVLNVHDLHIWMITSEYTSMTVHLEVSTDVDRDKITNLARTIIAKDFNVSHMTIQIEGHKELCALDDRCN